MDQELALGFLDIGRAIQQQADLGQRQHRHHQRVVPHLARILVIIDDVLEPAFLGLGQAIGRHQPFGPHVQIGDVARIGLIFIQIGQRDERGHRVDILGRRAFGKAILEPLLDDAQRLLVAGLLEIAPHAEQADAVGPFPPGPALGVDDAAIFQMEQEFACLGLDIDEIVHQPVDGFDDLLARYIMGESGHLLGLLEV